MREKDLSARFDEGISRLRDRDFAGAREILEEVAYEQPGYREVEAWLEAARDGRWTAMDAVSLEVITPANTDRLRELQRWGRGSIQDLAFSPDGRILAVGSSSGVWVYDADTLAPVRLLEGKDMVIMSIDFSASGRLLATLSLDGTIRIWSVSGWELIHEWEKHISAESRVALSPNEELVAARGDPGQCRVWRVSDGELVYTLELEGHTEHVDSVAFSPDGSVLASGSKDKTVRLWSVSDGELLNTLEGHARRVSGVSFSPDGALLASGSGDVEDFTVRLWRVSDGELVRSLEGHTGTVYSVAFSPDGELLASASGGDTVRLWRVSDGKQVRILKGHDNGVNIVAFSPDGRFLALGGNWHSLQLRRVSDGELVHAVEGGIFRWRGVIDAFSPDGRLVSLRESETVQLRRVPGGEPAHKLTGHEKAVEGTAFSPDGTLLASGSMDKTIKLWRVSDGKLLHTWVGAEHMTHVTFSPDGTLIASVCSVHGLNRDTVIQFWRVSDGKLISTVEGVTRIIHGSDGQMAAYCVQDEVIRLWSVPGGEPECITRMEKCSDRIGQLFFAPDGRLLNLDRSRSPYRVWNVSTGELVGVLEEYGERYSRFLRCVAFNPGGDVWASLAGLGYDEHTDTARLWSFPDCKHLGTLRHAHWESGVVFSPDGKLIASSAMDGTVRLWGVVE